MTDVSPAPWRHQFDNARDPYTARNALGITSTGGGGGGYITSVSAPLAVTGSNLSIDLSAYLTIAAATATYAPLANPTFTGDPKAPTPATADNDTSIATTAYVQANLGNYLTTAGAAAAYQPLDADLTAIAALAGTNTIYYRSGANTWSAVTISTGLNFSGGVLANTVSIAGLAPLASPVFTGDPTAPTPAPGDNDTSIATTAFVATAVTAGIAAGASPTPPQGRLTLQTLTPVMITSQSAKTTIYYTSYVGNLVPIYNGTAFAMTSIGAEISVATTNTTKSPAAIGASKVNDWFVWIDAGTVRIGHGPDWTSDTARSAGTALVMVNGILLNNASITNGPAAQRGTYVGTTRSNASSQLDWIYGTLAAGGGAGFFGVWNAYNRVDVATNVQDSTASWTYSTATWRASNNSATIRVSWVCGLAEDSFDAICDAMGSHTTSLRMRTAIGIDSTTSPSGLQGSRSSTANSSFTGTATVPPALGFHFVSQLEFLATTTATATWFGGGETGLHFRGRL